ncbi:MAG: hypothetical protein JWQ35_2020 [Bacteriovoracaceae bacterium]|nr:hypothetical protein [Bacteriovoracaceae bacterium]
MESFLKFDKLMTLTAQIHVDSMIFSSSVFMRKVVANEEVAIKKVLKSPKLRTHRIFLVYQISLFRRPVSRQVMGMKSFVFLFSFSILISLTRSEGQPLPQEPQPLPKIEEPTKTEAPGVSSAPAPATSADEPVNIETKVSAPTAAAIEEPYKEERAKIAERLAKEIEPNLIKSDIQRLTKNVMRLGSYRKDWVQTSQDFLVANSALAELYIYKFSLLGNKRLNRSGLQTLTRFSTLREPRALLAHLYLFVDDQQEMMLSMALLSKAIEQEPSLAPEAIQFLNGPIGEKISLENKLQFGIKACGKLPSASLTYKEMLKSWKSKSSTFWELVLADELDHCLKGV